MDSVLILFEREVSGWRPIWTDLYNKDVILRSISPFMRCLICPFKCGNQSREVGGIYGHRSLETKVI